MKTRNKLFLILLVLFSYQSLAAQDVAIVVNKDNPVSDLSLDMVVKFFKADKKRWENGGKVKLAVMPLSSPAGKTILAKIYKMSEKEYKKFWLKKVFKGDAVAPVKKGSASDILSFLTAEPNGLAFIPASNADASVKILSINGKKPGDADYPLR